MRVCPSLLVYICKVGHVGLYTWTSRGRINKSLM